MITGIHINSGWIETLGWVGLGWLGGSLQPWINSLSRCNGRTSIPRAKCGRRSALALELQLESHHFLGGPNWVDPRINQDFYGLLLGGV
jgi:hypothetical protein